MGIFWSDSLKKLDIFIYLYYMEFSFFKSVFMTQTIGEAFRAAVLTLPSNLSPEKRLDEIANILDQLTNNGNENLVLKNADLSNLGLQDVDFSGDDLSEANLKGTDLRGANFWEANLTNAQMDDDTQLSGAIGLLQGWIDNNNTIQNNTINITPNVQFPDDVVEAFRKAIKTNANFWNEYTYEDPKIEVTVKHLTLNLPAQDFEAFKTSIQNQIRTYRIKKFVQKAKDPAYSEHALLEGGECSSFISERIQTLNNLIEELRDQNGIFDIAGEDLSGLDLRSLDLHNTNFTKCNLRGTDLLGSKLDGADLTDAITDDQRQWLHDSNSSGRARG